jgi:hypothetical protein
MPATELEFSRARSCCCSSSDQTRYFLFCVIPIWRANRRHASRGCPDSRTSEETRLLKQIASPAASRDNSLRTISLALRDHLNARRRPMLIVAGHIVLDSGASHSTRRCRQATPEFPLLMYVSRFSRAVSQFSGNWSANATPLQPHRQRHRSPPECPPGPGLPTSPESLPA